MTTPKSSIQESEEKRRERSKRFEPNELAKKAVLLGKILTRASEKKKVPSTLKGTLRDVADKALDLAGLGKEHSKENAPAQSTGTTPSPSQPTTPPKPQTLSDIMERQMHSGMTVNVSVQTKGGRTA